MSITIWRYAHLILAIVSAVFLTIAALTGIILAFEPISEAALPFKKAALNQVSLEKTIRALQNHHDEILALEIDANDFVIASVITKTGRSERIYVDPVTGNTLGSPKEKLQIYKWAVTLHRSLFLKTIGRAFVGVISFLLCLICVTGFFLLARRQGGIKRIFSKVQKDTFAQRYHAITGQWAMLPVFLVAATGLFLSAEKFSLLPKTPINDTSETIVTDEERGAEGTTPIFQTIFLNDVRLVTFPFSDAPEDHFEIDLRDRQILVHQHSGAILNEKTYPFVTLVSSLSLKLHTGQGSILWSLLLIFTGISILFFVYSGTIMGLKRLRRLRTLNPMSDKDTSEYILLVGSETGTTSDFATLFQNALVRSGKSVFKAPMDYYNTYKMAKHIIVFTATYGKGDPPANARNFINLFNTTPVRRPMQYSVLGFGSLRYPEYCQYAVDVAKRLQEHPYFKSSVPLNKINNASFAAFDHWVSQWGLANKVPLQLQKPPKPNKKFISRPFKVIHRTLLNGDDTFLIRLRPQNYGSFESGDLLVHCPEAGSAPRRYSIARIENDILLSIKKHEFGMSSNYFYSVTENDIVHAAIEKNPSFHLPKNIPCLLCIGNGTGIAPFLGIIAANERHIPIQLYWGGRTENSLSLYKTYLNGPIATKKLTSFKTAYSRGPLRKMYVQDLLKQERILIAEQLSAGAVIMLCGSIAMQQEVLRVLEVIVAEQLKTSLSEFERKGQLKMDCY